MFLPGAVVVHVVCRMLKCVSELIRTNIVLGQLPACAEHGQAMRVFFYCLLVRLMGLVEFICGHGSWHFVGVPVSGCLFFFKVIDGIGWLNITSPMEGEFWAFVLPSLYQCTRELTVVSLPLLNLCKC